MPGLVRAWRAFRRRPVRAPMPWREWAQLRRAITELEVRAERRRR